MADGYEPKLSNLHGERITVAGTTNDAGIIAVPVGLKYTNEVFVLTNIASEYNKPYLVTIYNYYPTDNYVNLRIRNNNDHSAVTNTEVNFTALVLGIIAQ